VILRGQGALGVHGLEALTARYGVQFGDRVVLDPHPVPGATPLLAFTLEDGWGDHPAVHSLIGQPVSLMTVRELTLDESRATFLLQTSEQGWAEADIEGLQSGGVPRHDASRDRIGPIPVAAAAELGGSRLVVIASQDFALNAVLRADVIYDHGRDLILNTIGWLAQREALLGIRAREREHVKLVLRPDQVQRMSLVCLVGLPGFAIALGFLVLWRRRR
jgi:ABC-2 type transport system permease protein